jgi:glycosyltransferase involved in cell wall biosynthesis
MVFVNDVQPVSGVGKYSMELAKRLDTEFFQISYPSRNEKWMKDVNYDQKVEMLRSPIFEQTINKKFNILDRKLPERDFYHFSNQDIVSNKQNAIWTVHDIFPVTWHGKEPSMYNHLKDSTVIVNSEYTKQQLKKLPFYDSLDIHVVYLGVDKEIFRTIDSIEPAQDKIRIINVGTEVERKNISELFEVIAELKKKTKKEVELVRVGSQSSEFKKILQNLSIEENVVYKSGITEEKLAKEYNKADYFVSTAKDEGFCLPALEAIACGTKTILSDIPVFRELYSDYACVTENFVSEILTTHDIRTNDEIAYSWDKTAEQTQSVYNKFNLG